MSKPEPVTADERAAIDRVNSAIIAALQRSAGQIAVVRRVTLDDAQTIYQAGVTAWLDESAKIVSDETIPKHIRARIAGPVQQETAREAVYATIMRAALEIAGAVAPVAHIAANTAANSATRDVRARPRKNDHPSAEKHSSKRN